MWARLLPLFFCFALTSCTVYEKACTYDFKDRLSYVRIGMDESRMLELMGKPFANVQQEKKTYYIFLSNALSQEIPVRYSTVVVENGRVSNTRASKPSDFESKTPS